MTVVYPSKSMVSIWVGTCASEDVFDEGVDKEIAPKLGLQVELAAICEVGHEPEPVPLDKLLNGFSGCSSFIAQAVSAGVGQGVSSANSAIVCYHLECRDAPVMWGQFHFLGSMPGSDILS